MPLRELLYYPPFFAVLALALFIGVVFVTLILLERRRVQKMRQVLQPGMPPGVAARGETAPKPTVAREKPTVAPVREAPPALVREVPLPVIPATPVASSTAGTPAGIRQEAASAALPAKEVLPPAAVIRESPVVLPFPSHSSPTVAQESRPTPVQARETPKATVVATLPAAEEASAAPAGAPAMLDFRTFDRQSSLSADFVRSIIIGLAMLVVVCLTLLILPQTVFDRMTDSLRYRNSNPTQQEMLAFLYLGDEVKGSEFHIRGVVRNITAKPIDELDAFVRLYASDRTLLETAVVRMDVDHIEPDATASFNLSYPDYHAQFGSYSVDFKLRRGEPVPFKDMRGIRARD